MLYSCMLELVKEPCNNFISQIVMYSKIITLVCFVRWKDPNCEFRKDNTTSLTCVPTLHKWGTNKRLLDNQCNNLETVLMMFED